MNQLTADSKSFKHKLVLITGGARSGKSRFAEQYVSELDSDPAKDIVYIATSQVLDEEMKRRVESHQNQRPSAWRTIEEPYDVENVIQRMFAEPVSVVLLDCITLWISNLLLSDDNYGTDGWKEPKQSEYILQRVKNLVNLLKAAPFSTILVTNEVGDSLVPEYELGRIYRDLAGQVNQALAAKSDDVFLVICGIPVNLREVGFRSLRAEQ